MKFFDKIENGLRDYFINWISGERSGFEAAQSGRLYNDWMESITSINQDINEGYNKLVSRGRAAAQNDPYAHKFLNDLTKNVIGHKGFVLRSKAFDVVKEKGEESVKFNRPVNLKIQFAWKKWTNKKNCSISKDVSFREFCKIILKSVARDGEIFIQLIKNPNILFGFALQAIETEYIDYRLNKTDLPGGNYIIMGVEFNKHREAVKYHALKAKSHGTYYSHSTEHEPIEASKIIHLFVKESTYQVRGISWFAPALVRLHMLHKYEEALLMKARAGATITVMLTPKDDKANANVKAGIVGAKKTPTGETVKALEPLEPFISPKGYDVEAFDPKTPTGSEGTFIDQQLRGAASGLGISFIALANNYQKVNYSSGRLNLLDERDTWKDCQSWFTEHFLDDIYEQWLEMALTVHSIEGLNWKHFDYCNNANFQPRSFPWIDPKNEAMANKIAEDELHKSLVKIVEEQGLDFEEHLDELEYVQKELKRRKLSKAQQKLTTTQILNVEDEEEENEEDE